MSSILKKLQKKSKKNDITLSSGVVLLLDSQVQFNKLAKLFGLQEDSITIDDIYVAYMDEYPALQVEPAANFSEDTDDLLEAFKHKNLKPLDIDVWFKRKGIK